jgi:uncharacterized YccA/Bax inhibitor family protein
VGLVLGLIISFSRMANPALVVTYAVVEGAFVGLASKFFQEIAGYQDIVLQAVVATFGVFFVMAFLYRARVIRATPRFARIMIAVIGRPVRRHADHLGAVDLRLSAPACAATARSASSSASICIVVAALSFILSFDEVEQGSTHGAAAALLVDGGVRHPRQPDLAVPGDSPPAEFPARRRLTFVSRQQRPAPSPHGPGAAFCSGTVAA